ncbi:uncharacterized protein BDV17DRAFT_8259 [Aspergillus undulatus]|uniref:uncharacterized protein n=1 Tax=Aspergillus undulatus TaxID=1810928 RepID=UPI003CCCEEAD
MMKTLDLMASFPLSFHFGFGILTARQPVTWRTAIERASAENEIVGSARALEHVFVALLTACFGYLGNKDQRNGVNMD